ncbi:rhomboid family intramembrane serine protease [Photobacterium sp. TY1-4]|uniref:rhomboid family intramembrane serine protease n=1 Tax=Photobacterium sp. TY1-4 TaxID=2899122 RepID=UPI0021C12E75|nr:rhomboid family intramembrane serine protease [Photobacterium sp. TY1-4]UXI02518.1 rhomboid family intramembrane serine protease [Photobacterium sp. TY1-4]
MQLKQIPYMTLILVAATITTSLTVNYLISGTLFGKIKVPDLEPFGGYTVEHIADFELWRLVVSQLIHVKQAHMFYNALSLLALGYLLERRIGSLTFTFIWLFAGAAGTFVSTFTVPAPWNLGTGGSQAILALAAAGLVLYICAQLKSKFMLSVIALTILPAFALDLIYAENHLPKPGHVVSFSLGLLFTAYLLRRSSANYNHT